MKITRRTALASAAAAGAASLAEPFALNRIAAANQPGKQAASYYRYKVGDFEVTAISDGVLNAPIQQGFVKNASVDDVNAALEAAFMPRGTLANQFNPVLINTGSQLILVDTGNGPGRSPTTGMLLAGGLAAAGVDPKQVNTVIISHFHGDHIGGLRSGDGPINFPNAEIIVPADEWAFWMDDGNMSRAPESGPVRTTFQNTRRIFAGMGDKVKRFERGKDVVPGITSIATTGHTPGHSSFLVTSGSGKLVIQADVTGNPAVNLRNPGWHSWADMDGPQAEASRRKLFDMVAADRIPITGYHYPFPALGHIEKDGDRYQLVPAPWQPII